jgi:hypothetical protein
VPRSTMSQDPRISFPVTMHASLLFAAS